MDENVFEALISWQFVLFCLGIAAITFVMRKLIEFFVLDNPKMPGTRTSMFWRDLVLPIFPIVSGALMGAFIHKYPFPEHLHSTGGRAIFGLVAGLLSSQIYRIMTSVLKNKFGVGADDGADQAKSVGDTIKKD